MLREIRMRCCGEFFSLNQMHMSYFIYNFMLHMLICNVPMLLAIVSEYLMENWPWDIHERGIIIMALQED